MVADVNRSGVVFPRVWLTTDGALGKLTLDGRDISAAVRSAQFTVDGGMPIVVVELYGADSDIELETARVVVAERCLALLVALGWTPPSGTDGSDD